MDELRYSSDLVARYGRLGLKSRVVGFTLQQAKIHLQRLRTQLLNYFLVLGINRAIISLLLQKTSNKLPTLLSLI